MSMRAHLTATTLDGQTLVDADVDDVELRNTLTWRIGDVRQSASMSVLGSIALGPAHVKRS